MSHPQQQQYCQSVKAKFPFHFRNCKVLDVGSLNINGHNRDLFTNCEYTGLDIAPGSNVDVVSKAHEFVSPYQFDTIISTEMLEHDPYWQESIRNMVNHLKPGGLLLLTCAGPGRPEHGTRKDQPACSPLTVNSNISVDGKSWADYYQNLSPLDLGMVLGEFQWSHGEYSSNTEVHDTYFYGIKT